MTVLFQPTKTSCLTTKILKEAAEYQEQIAQEEEEDEMLWSRFSGEEDVENWFVVLFIIFVSLVDRKRVFGPVN